MTTQELINKILEQGSVTLVYNNNETIRFDKTDSLASIENFTKQFPDCKLQEVFIPTHFFSTITEEWEETNEIKENWLEDETWTNCVKSIIPFGSYIMVIWNKIDDFHSRHLSTMYKGTLIK